MNENLISALEHQDVVTATFRRLSAAKKEKIYSVALALFSSEEFDRVTLDEIAENSRISKGSLIQYFSNKDNLLHLTAELLVDQFLQFGQEHFKKESSEYARQRLLDYLMAYYRFWLGEKAKINFFLRYFLVPGQLVPEKTFMILLDSLRDNIETIITEGINGGEIRRDISIERIMLIFLSLQDGIMREISYDPENIDEETIYNSLKRMIDLVFDGIAGERKVRSLS